VCAAVPADCLHITPHLGRRASHVIDSQDAHAQAYRQEVYVEILSAAIGASFIAAMLWDAFETIVLPRRVTRRMRLARLFYRYTWLLYSKLVSGLSSARRRDSYYSFYGPLSLLGLLCLWALGLMMGFALLHHATGSALSDPHGAAGFLTDLYCSGTTFFTLGLGDVTPRTPAARFLVVIEAGTGFAFLALVIGYLPSLNQSFSRREVSISLLDARAGSPPTAAQMVIRHRGEYGMQALQDLLHEWEQWAAEFLEIHLSYPVLAYFRSQHDNQSWLAALTAILDASALAIVGIPGACQRQADRTFAIARHAVVDLAIVFNTPPLPPVQDRLSAADLVRLREMLAQSGLNLADGDEADLRLMELRLMYEPYVCALSQHFRITLPPWFFDASHPDNWQMSAWPAPRVARDRNPRHF
jgi:hypothetical protein